MNSFINTGRRHLMAEINVVPYVDVMMVLLLVFMIAAPMLTQGVIIDLPKEAQGPLAVDEPLPIVVSVDKNGNYFVNIAEAPAKPIAFNLLEKELVFALKQVPKRQILVRGDKDATYGKVLNLFISLQKLGITNVGLETDSEA